MSLQEKIKELRDRTLNLLNDAHNYYDYTVKLWGILQVDVYENERKISFRNPYTNDEVDGHILLVNAQRYKSSILPASTIQRFVSLFENFLFEITKTWLLKYPHSIFDKNSKKEDAVVVSNVIKEIMKLTEKSHQVIPFIIDKKLMDLSYGKPSKWFSYIEKITEIDKLDQNDLLQFYEIKATRDVFVHGQGVANDIYCEKSGNRARTKAGTPLDIDEPYHQESWQLICKLTQEIGTRMAKKAAT